MRLGIADLGLGIADRLAIFDYIEPIRARRGVGHACEPFGNRKMGMASACRVGRAAPYGWRRYSERERLFDPHGSRSDRGNAPSRGGHG